MFNFLRMFKPKKLPPKIDTVPIRTICAAGGSGGNYGVEWYGFGGSGKIFTVVLLSYTPPDDIDFLIVKGEAYRKIKPDEEFDHQFSARDGSQWVKIRNKK